MSMPKYPPIDKLNSIKLLAFARLFADLPAPAQAFTKGTWQAAFVGPAWLRWMAPRGLVLLHFAGWWGKEFSGDGTGFNYFKRAGEMQQAFPMQVTESTSLIDGKPCLVVQYGMQALFPWRFIVDELRQLDENLLLGMTIVNRSGLRAFPLPFLLTKMD
jgi:hypothetical protein